MGTMIKEGQMGASSDCYGGNSCSIHLRGKSINGILNLLASIILCQKRRLTCVSFFCPAGYCRSLDLVDHFQ